MTSALVVLIAAQGALGVAQLQFMASRAASPEPVFASLRAVVPPRARIIGVPHYWLAFPEYDYRSYVLLEQLAGPRLTPNPISWAAAFEQVAPRVVLLDPDLAALFADRSTPFNRERSEAYDYYMGAHQAHLLAELPDERGGTLRVYQLAP